MNDVSDVMTSISDTNAGPGFHTLLPAERHDTAPSVSRAFHLEAHFATGGTWSGVDQLIEVAYLSLLEMRQDRLIDQHLLELHMVLLDYRDRIQPKYWCLTDTAAAEEKTRFYPVDRAYRLVNGLVELVLSWKRALGDQGRWTVVAQNFNHAQHLATLFFSELARRGAGAWIEVVTEGGVSSAPPPRDTVGLGDVAIPSGADVRLEGKYPALYRYHQDHGNGLEAANLALQILTLYNSHGYYNEAKSFIGAIMPYFDELVGDDEVRRLEYASKINTSLFMTNDPTSALSVISERAAPYLTKPHLLANMNYIIAMHHLRYAEVKDLRLAEQHILRAVAIMQATDNDPAAPHRSFRKVFIDNGLAFLRARQGRHQEALDLCRSGYEFLTNKMGEDHHRLHRSILQYNIAQVYVMLQCLDAGLEHYRKAIAMDPNYSEYHNEVGNILQDLGRHREAIACYEQAIRCSAPYPEVFFNKAVCHARLQEQAEALVCFDMTLELNPQHQEAHALRADTCRELGDAAAALAGYDDVIAMGYESAAVRINRAVLHYNYHCFDRALADMDHVIALAPHEAGHYENRAAIYQAMGRHDLYLRDMGLANLGHEAA
jgi:tetratricopeptide (TPR) repeat protein